MLHSIYNFLKLIILDDNEKQVRHLVTDDEDEEGKEAEEEPPGEPEKDVMVLDVCYNYLLNHKCHLKQLDYNCLILK